MISLPVRVVSVLLVVVASPLFFVLAIRNRMKEPTPLPTPLVLLSPLSRRDGQ